MTTMDPAIATVLHPPKRFSQFLGVDNAIGTVDPAESAEEYAPTL